MEFTRLSGRCTNICDDKATELDSISAYPFSIGFDETFWLHSRTYVAMLINELLLLKNNLQTSCIVMLDRLNEICRCRFWIANNFISEAKPRLCNHSCVLREGFSTISPAKMNGSKPNLAGRNYDTKGTHKKIWAAIACVAPPHSGGSRAGIRMHPPPAWDWPFCGLKLKKKLWGGDTPPTPHLPRVKVRYYV